MFVSQGIGQTQLRTTRTAQMVQNPKSILGIWLFNHLSIYLWILCYQSLAIMSHDVEKGDVEPISNRMVTWLTLQY